MPFTPPNMCTIHGSFLQAYTEQCCYPLVQVLEGVLCQPRENGMPAVEDLPQQLVDEAVQCFARVSKVGAKLLGLLSLQSDAEKSQADHGWLEQCKRTAEGKAALAEAKMEACKARQANSVAVQRMRALEQQVQDLAQQLVVSEQRAEVRHSLQFCLQHNGANTAHITEWGVQACRRQKPLARVKERAPWR